jgi:hypothetical protein
MQREIRSLEQIEDRQRKRENNRADENPEDAEGFCATERGKEDQQRMHFDVRADHSRSDQHIDLPNDGRARDEKHEGFHPVAGHDQNKRRRCHKRRTQKWNQGRQDSDKSPQNGSGKPQRPEGQSGKRSLR